MLEDTNPDAAFCTWKEIYWYVGSYANNFSKVPQQMILSSAITEQYDDISVRMNKGGVAAADCRLLWLRACP